MSSYTIFLSLHNLIRWATLVLGAFAVFRAGTGLLAKGVWLPSDDKARKLFPIALDIQFTVGIILSLLSPLVKAAWSNLSVAMTDHAMRFYAVEHGFIGIVALVLVHVGSVRIRRTKDVRIKFKTMFTFYGLAFLMIAIRIPWDRPLFRIP